MVKERHITKYANEQFSDFAQVLGLPKITMENLYNRFDQKEPIVIDSIRESAFFAKMVEGYPFALDDSKQIGEVTGLHLAAGEPITDFYMSMGMVPRLNAAIT